MAHKDSLYKDDTAVQKRNKLMLTEQQLIAVLDKINKELNQTEVEWLHLKSLAEPRKEAKKTSIETPKEISMKQTIKDKHDIDDQAVNTTQLDLSLGILDKHDMTSDKEDSD